MHKTIVKLDCPSCGQPSQAVIHQTMKFILYVCPGCQSNVVYYNHKLDIISDDMVNKLLLRNRLVECGNIADGPDQPHFDHIVNKDDIMDLKIVLETCTSLEEFLKKI